jgi:exodeoxyribonuclease V alpha subunit
MTGEIYEQWVAGIDLDAGRLKGRVRDDANALRFVEVTVNGPKTWSLAAALHPEISAALDAAHDKAAAEIVGWVAGHATTRVGPRGRQVQVPVEQIEAAVIRHYTSRAGDPHRHLHLQINARVWVAGAWRGIHSVGIRDSIEAINGIGHAAVATDREFRSVLAAHGFTLDPETSEVRELAPFVGAFSARTAQIRRNVDRYEATWRTEHPDQEPGRRLREAWDRRAWAQARPDKVVPTDGAELVARWNGELRELGYRDPAQPVPLAGTRPGWIDRDAAAELVVSILGSNRSAWNTADIRGKTEILLAQTCLLADPAARAELAEDITARAADRCIRGPRGRGRPHRPDRTPCRATSPRGPHRRAWTGPGRPHPDRRGRRPCRRRATRGGRRCRRFR